MFFCTRFDHKFLCWLYVNNNRTKSFMTHFKQAMLTQAGKNVVILNLPTRPFLPWKFPLLFSVTLVSFLSLLNDKIRLDQSAVYRSTCRCRICSLFISLCICLFFCGILKSSCINETRRKKYQEKYKKSQITLMVSMNLASTSLSKDSKLTYFPC